MTEDMGYIGNLGHRSYKRLGAIRTIHTKICTVDRNRPLYMDIHLRKASKYKRETFRPDFVGFFAEYTFSVKIRIRLNEIF